MHPEESSSEKKVLPIKRSRKILEPEDEACVSMSVAPQKIELEKNDGKTESNQDKNQNVKGQGESEKDCR